MALVATVHPADDPTAASLGTLSSATAKSFRRAWKDVGGGTVTVPRNSADAALLLGGRYVRFTLNGFVHQVIRIAGRSQSTVAQGEHAAQLRTVTGAGLPSTLADARVYAPPGIVNFKADTRHFNFASPDYPHESDPMWAASVIIFQYNDVNGYGVGVPTNWPAQTAAWMWGTPLAFASPPQDVGDCYFRNTFTIADDADCAFYIAADDGFELWVDGELLAAENQAFLWRETRRVTRYCFAGTHTVAIKGTNINRAVASTNGAAIIFAAYTLAFGGANDTLLIQSDNSWLCAAYPAAPPGWTPGAVMKALIDEAHGRAATPLAAWIYDFDENDDSNGNPWPSTISPAYPVGATSVLDVLLQLGGWAVDWDLRYDLVRLSLAPFGDFVGSSAVTLDEGVNLQELSHDEADSQGTVVYTRLGDGTYAEYSAGGSPRVELYASMGAAVTNEDADAQDAALLDDVGVKATATAKMAPVAGSIPFSDFFVGDVITAVDMDGVAQDQLVKAITCSSVPASSDGTVAGREDFTVELVQQ